MIVFPEGVRFERFLGSRKELELDCVSIIDRDHELKVGARVEPRGLELFVLALFDHPRMKKGKMLDKLTSPELGG